MNFCNKRKFPDHFYDVYKLSKHDRGKYLNTWFKGEYFAAKKDKDIIYTDDWWTYKKVDKDTSWRLYNIRYNPIELGIMCPTGAKFKVNEAGEKLYNMLAIIQ